MSGLQRQVVPVLLKGLDQLAPKQTGIMSGVDAVLNMIAQAGDQNGYEFIPRPGVDTLPVTGMGSPVGQRLSVLNNQLLQFTTDSLYRRVSKNSTWYAVAKPSASPFGNGVSISSQTTDPMLADTPSATECDVAYVNGYKITAIVGTQLAIAGAKAIYISVSDPTGALLAATTTNISFTSVCPRIAVSGNLALVFWADTTSTSIQAIKFDSTTGFLGTVVGLTSGATATAPVFDVQTIPSSGKIALMYQNGINLQQTLVDPVAMTIGSIVSYSKGNPFATKGYLANSFSTNTIFYAYITASGLKVDQFDGTTLAAGTSTVYDATVTAGASITGYRTGTSTATVYFTVKGTNPYDDAIWTSTGGTATKIMLGRAIASRATLVTNGSATLQPLFLTKYRGVGQCTYFLVDTNKTTPLDMGRFLPDVAAADPSNTLAGLLTLPNLMVGATASTYITCGLSSTGLLVGANGTLTSSTGGAVFTFVQNDTTIGRPVELNGALHIPGALPFLYDGNSLTEEGFPIAPEQSDAYTFGAGSMTPSSIYTYRYVFEWIDAFGALHQSAPNLTAQTANLPGGNGSVIHSIPVVIGTRKAHATVAIYRTVANGDGSTYYRAGSVDFFPQTIPGSGRVSFTDSMSDTTLVSQPPLYIDGGILENLAPPPCTSMAIHNGRILAGGIAGDQTAIWFSKDVSLGFGIAFNDGLVSRLNSANSAVTALGSMDSFAAAFTTNTTWTSSDNYPDDTGTGGVLKFIQASAVNGCASPRLIARGDDGLVCWQAKTAANAFVGTGPGPWRFSRGSSWDWIGKAIQLDTATLTPVTFLLVPGSNQLRIVGAASTGGLGAGATVLVRETTFETWATWQYSSLAPILVDAIVWNGSVVYLKSNGELLIENMSTFYDSGGISIAHSITLSPFSFAGVAGYQRIYVGQLTGRMLGGTGVSNTANVSITQIIDGVAMAPKVITLTPDANALFDGAEFDPGPNGKCSAYQVTISNAIGDMTVPCAWTLAAVTMSVGIKPSLNRLPPSRRAV